MKASPLKSNHKYVIVFAATLAIRLIVAMVFIDVFPEWPTGSSIEYRVGLAEGILNGEGFSFHGTPNLYQTPVYPFFLALVFFILGNYWWSVAILQAVLEGFSSVGLSVIGNKFSEKGWIAGLIYAAYPYAVMQSRSIVDTPLFVFLFIWSIVFFVKFFDKLQLKHLIFGALFLGIGFLTRPTVFPIAFAFVFYLIVRRFKIRQIIFYASVAGLISIMIPLSWTVRNYLITDEFPVFAVGGSHIMWQSHNQHIYQIYQRGESPDEVGRDIRYPMTPNVKVSDFFQIGPKEQVRLGRTCSAQVSAWIYDHPSEVFQYSVLKLKTMLSWEYFPASINAPYHKIRLWIYRLTNGPVLLLGWLGLGLLILKRNQYAAFMWCIVIGFILVHVTSLPSSRHKIPLDALLMTVIPVSYEFLRFKFARVKQMVANMRQVADE